MTVLTREPARAHVQHPSCPHCGRPVDALRTSHLRFILETAVRLLAGAALALMLVPLGIVAWKSCANFLSNRESHSILFQPLEDWTRY